MEQNEVTRTSANNVLIWSIIGLIFCETGVIGLVFSIIARRQVKHYFAAGGTLQGRANVGNILSIVGLVISIVMTVYWLVCLICFGSLFGAVLSGIA